MPPVVVMFLVEQAASVVEAAGLVEAVVVEAVVVAVEGRAKFGGGCGGWEGISCFYSLSWGFVKWLIIDVYNHSPNNPFRVVCMYL
jgi:hypothetical protein